MDPNCSAQPKPCKLHHKEAEMWKENEKLKMEDKPVRRTHTHSCPGRYFCCLMGIPMYLPCFVLTCVGYPIVSCLCCKDSTDSDSKSYAENCAEGTLAQLAHPYMYFSREMEDYRWVTDEIALLAIKEILIMWAEKHRTPHIMRICSDIPRDSYGIEAINNVKNKGRKTGIVTPADIEEAFTSKSTSSVDSNEVNCPSCEPL